MCSLSRFGMILGLTVLVAAGTPAGAAEELHAYAVWDPGFGSVSGINGYIDTHGLIGQPGAEYIIFMGGDFCGFQMAYIYRVVTDGDPERHPDNLHNQGLIGQRSFVFHSAMPFGEHCLETGAAFYMDDTGIYYGPHGIPDYGIYHWGLDWTPMGKVIGLIPVPHSSDIRDLARNPATGRWWIGRADRSLHESLPLNGGWIHRATHHDFGGGIGHTGLEIFDNSVFVAELASELIGMYRMSTQGVPVSIPAPAYRVFTNSVARYCRTMGFGPNNHIWISSGDFGLIFEIGGPALRSALEGIPDQYVFSGVAFSQFDLDLFQAGVPPVTWSWSGNSILAVEADPENVVSVGYPDGWTGSETVTFTATDQMNSQVDDVAVFWVLPRTSIEDIEDQWLPFSRIELDTYLKNISPDLVEWSAQGMTCLNVEIDPVTHVATVTNPDGGCTEPETIVFTARSVIHGIEVRLTADVTFTPAFLLAVDIKPGSCANPLNVKSKGKLPVAVLGTGDLDVGTLDPETVQLEGVPALMWTHEDVGKPAESHGDCACHEEGPDGSMDMTLKFDRQEVIAALGEVEHGHICALRLSGRTHDGVPVEGWDCVRIAEGRAKNPGGFAGPVTVTGRKVNLSLEVPTAVSVKVYDVTGRIVRTLSSRPRAAGILAFEWDGCDDAGRPVVGGVYFCRVKAGSVTETVRMVISR